MSDTEPNTPLPLPAPSAGNSRTRRASPAMLGFVGGLIGGVAAAAIVGGVLTASWPELRDRILPPPASNEARFDDLAHRIAALETAAEKPAPPTAGPELAQLAQRVVALEQAPRAPATAATEDPRVDEMTGKIDQMAEQLAALRASSTTPADLDAKLARVEDAAKAAQDAASHRQSVEALLIVAGQLRDAVERGGPYATELAAARKIAPASATAALDALTPSADAGIPRLDALADRFPEVAAAIARATMIPSEGDDLWSRLKREAAKLVSIRRVDGAGSDAMAATARAEKALKAGNLNEAVSELSGLTGEAADAVKPWLELARARLAAERALADLTTATGVALAPSNG